MRDLRTQLHRAREAQDTAADLHARAVRACTQGADLVSEAVARRAELRRRAIAATESPQSFSTVFTGVGLSSVRRSVMRVAAAGGLTGDALEDFVLAVQELMTNAVRHGGGWGRVRLHRAGEVLVCAVTDHGGGFRADPAELGEPEVTAVGGRGLLLVRRLTHSMRVDSGPSGAVVTVTMRVPAAAAGV